MKMNKFNKIYNLLLERNKNDYEIYHKSFTEALNEVIKKLKEKGFKMDEADMARPGAHGGAHRLRRGQAADLDRDSGHGRAFRP